MECVKKESETYYTFKMTQYEQLLLVGLLSQTLEGEVKLDIKAKAEIKKLMNGLIETK